MRAMGKFSAAAAAMLAATGALAHEGHGIAGPHWHATDTAGVSLVVLLAAVAIWLARGK
jgi:hypothetical protein